MTIAQAQSLRHTLELFRAHNHLHLVEREVDAKFELGSVLSLRGKGQTQLFEQIKGYAMPVVGNLLNTHEKMALALGVSKTQLQSTLMQAVEHGIAPEVVSDGPAQEVIHLDADRDIDIPALLPVPHWFEREAAPYITAGVITAKDRDTGRRNVSIARLRVEGGNLLMAGIAPTHHLAELGRRAFAKGQPLEIAICIGNHPAVLLASQMYVELGHDEFDVAGALLGQPLRLAKGKTVNLEVPAEAEDFLQNNESQRAMGRGEAFGNLTDVAQLRSRMLRPTTTLTTLLRRRSSVCTRPAITNQGLRVGTLSKNPGL
ncbi:MAG: UbiD family decarboxylase [Anaerolineae bacterium]|nr:UbiD family decarboxylase [Anaerolineae bacterium]